MLPGGPQEVSDKEEMRTLLRYVFLSVSSLILLVIGYLVSGHDLQRDVFVWWYFTVAAVTFVADLSISADFVPSMRTRVERYAAQFAIARVLWLVYAGVSLLVIVNVLELFGGGI